MASKLVSVQELLALSKPQLVELANSLGIETKGLLKEQLQKEIQAFQGLTSETEKLPGVKSTSKQTLSAGRGRGKAVEKLTFSPTGLHHNMPTVGQSTVGHPSEVGNNFELKLKAEQMRKELDFMLKLGVIEESNSVFASPVVLVPKTDNSIRFCCDYKKLNEITQPDPFPLPRIDDLIDKVGKAKYMTKLDLSRGYWQVPMDEESIPISAFVTPFGQFQWKYMPFGLRNAPGTFSQVNYGCFTWSRSVYRSLFRRFDYFQWYLVVTHETPRASIQSFTCGQFNG